MQLNFRCADCGKGFSYAHILDAHAQKEHGRAGENSRAVVEVYRCDQVCVILAHFEGRK